MRFALLVHEARRLGLDWREDDVIASLGEWAVLTSAADRELWASARPDYDDEPETDGWALAAEPSGPWRPRFSRIRRARYRAND